MTQLYYMPQNATYNTTGVPVNYQERMKQRMNVEPYPIKTNDYKVPPVNSDELEGETYKESVQDGVFSKDCDRCAWSTLHFCWYDAGYIAAKKEVKEWTNEMLEKEQKMIDLVLDILDRYHLWHLYEDGTYVTVGEEIKAAVKALKEG